MLISYYRGRLGLMELLEVKTSEQKALHKRIVDLFRDKACLEEAGIEPGLVDRADIKSLCYLIFRDRARDERPLI